ncbi:MAG: T9SS type A sorting domain-containing protein [Bacteroidota bacterium]|jgi:hypothetical protein|nr:T9SS type A sorting domain-containing protein [Bacteroidota bacterium]
MVFVSDPPGRTAFRLLLILLLAGILPDTAVSQYTPSAWPLTFIEYTDSTGSFIQDVSDQNPVYTDIIYSTTTPSSVSVASDGASAFFRMQLKADPYRSNGTWAPSAWVVALSNSAGEGAPIGYVSVNASGNGLNVEIADQVVTDVIYTYAKNAPVTDAVRTLPAGTSGYYYLDFQVPMTAITARLGITPTTHVRFFYGSSTSGGTINKDFMTGTAVSFLGLATTNFSGIEHGGLAPNPVELRAFTAHVKNDVVVLRWRTATELNNFGFEVERALPHAAWETIGFVPGNGTVFSPRSYEFRDVSPPRTEVLRYRLRQIDRDGRFEYSPIVEAQRAHPTAMAITGSFPAPARAMTTINYAITQPGPVRLILNDIRGRVLRQVDEATAEAGAHSVLLDMTGVPPGVYLLRLIQAGLEEFRPLIVAE